MTVPASATGRPQTAVQPNPVRKAWQPALWSPAGRLLRWLNDFVRTPGRHREFALYTMVSGASLGVDFAAFLFLLQVALLPSAVAGGISVLVGLVLHYVLSISLVFDAAATGKSGRKLLIEYAATGVLGFVITASVIFAAVDLVGLPPWLGKGFAVGATFVSVYLVRAGIVFAPRQPKENPLK